MTRDKVWFVVSLDIHEGKLEAFEAMSQKMAARTEEEAGTLAYEFCLSDDRTRCRLVEEYVDAQAVLTHMTSPVVQEMVPQLFESSTISGFEVYGDPGIRAGEILKSVGAELFGPWHGYTR